MAAFLTVPKSRLDLARILKANDYNIAQTVSDLQQTLDLNEDKKDSLSSLLLRIRDTTRKAKKFLDSLEGDWWHSDISLEPPKKISVIDIEETHYPPLHHRKGY